MLELLALRQGHTITKEIFLNQLYGGMDEPEQKIIDCSSASFARSSPTPPAVRTTSRRSGAAGMRFERRQLTPRSRAANKSGRLSDSLVLRKRPELSNEPQLREFLL